MRYLTPLVLLLFCAVGLAQDSSLPEYGDISELKDLHKVYITADEISSRKLIIFVFKKYPGLTIVNNPDEAEFIVSSQVKSSTEARGRQRSHYLRTEMKAYKLTDKGRQRILWSEDETYEESSGLSLSRPNDYNLANHFVKALKKIRGEKK